MNRVKILYLIGTLDVGGSERQLVELVTRLDRARFDPVVCCLSTGGAFESVLRSARIPVHVVGFRGIGRRRILTRLPTLARELTRLVRVMRAESPDVVHGFLFWAYVLGAFVARAARVPIVIASRRSLSLFKAGRPHYRLVERIANALTDLFIANSEAVRQDAIATEHIPPAKIDVIYNGLDADSFLAGDGAAFRRQHAIPPQSPVIAVVANFIAYKGHRYFLAGWRRVIERRPEAVAVLAGDGVVRGQIEAEAAARGLTGSLRFVGSYRDIPSLLAASDMLVHPSLQEGFSNAVIEAMAAERPVIATSVGGNTEAIIDGVTGLLVPPANGDVLADAMLRLLERPSDAARMGRAGRARAAEQFDVRSMVERYESIYERMVRPAALVAQGAVGTVPNDI